MDEGFRVKLGAVSVRGAEDGDEIRLPEFLSGFLDQLLTLRVKRTGRRSHEALGLDEHWLRAGTAHTGLDGGPLDAVALADDDYLLSLQLHSQPTFSSRRPFIKGGRGIH
jgi:hypothetical protein